MYVYRYVALREILMYHVGFESITDMDEDTVRYAPFESLLIDQRDSGIETRDMSSKSIFTVPNYKGRNMLSANMINAAENILTAQLRGSNTIHPLSLTHSVIRALYGMKEDFVYLSIYLF